MTRQASWLALAVLVALAGLATGALGLKAAWEAHRRFAALALDPAGVEPTPRLFAPVPGRSGAVRIEAGSAVHVVLFGDSRISGWTPAPGVEGAALTARGRSGDTTALALLRLQRDVLSLEPDIVVVQSGINDMKAIGLFPDQADSIASRAEANLETITERLRRAGARVLLMTIIPPGRVGLLRRVAWSPAIEAAVGRVNRRIRALASDGVTVFDCDPVLAPAGRLDPRFERDTLHLNAAGYEALGAALAPVLEGMVSGPGAAGGDSPAPEGAAAQDE